MDFQEAIEKKIKYYEKECQYPLAKAEGDAFEELCAFYLENGPWGKENGAHVWKWGNAQNPLTLGAENDRDRSSQDKGCDLVIQTNDGSYFVVQCKYYPKSTLTLDGAHLANIFPLATRYKVPDEHIAFCYIADYVSPEAEDVLNSHRCFTKEAFENFDYSPMFGGKREPKELRKYQSEAVRKCKEGFEKEESEGKSQIGKLIMACGTGKTFTAFSLARSLSEGNPYTVLFLAPSISLVSQTFQDWGTEADGNISSLIVCSDTRADKGKESGEELIDERPTQIPCFGVTTDAAQMEEKWKKVKDSASSFRVIFSTYQSIEAVREFQVRTGIKFDLTICDEAHHTATHEDSVYAKAAEPGYINTVKKLFMTATPRVYTYNSKQNPDEEYAETIYSMDDEEKYGPEFYKYSFDDAVRGVDSEDGPSLCDYRVLVLAMRKSKVSLKKIQDLISNTDIAQDKLKELEEAVKDAVEESEKARAEAERREYIRKLSTLAGKIQGSYIDLSDLEASNQEEVARRFGGKIQVKVVEDKPELKDTENKHFAHSAVGFANTIDTSKLICHTFERFNEEFLEDEEEEGFKGPKIECRHIDGTMPSDERLRDLSWLKRGQKTDEIRLLTNAQCLSEGVDVPNLDAVVFFEKRSSRIGIIQAIGRVMRKAPGKDFGYIVLPVMVDDLQNPEHELATNEEYGVIWEVLQTMRSIDERLNAKINTLDYVKKAQETQEEGTEEKKEDIQQPESFSEDFQKAFVSVSVSKLKSSLYWKKWADNISGSVRNMINEINKLADTPEIKPKFEEFKDNLSKTLHKEQSKGDAVNLIAQFIVTRPVFSILFPASDFDSNPISRALEGIVGDFKEASSSYEEKLGEDLKADMKAATEEMAKSPAAKKELVKDFYEAFYQKVFPKEAKANGIVYTPVPVVDFMLKETDRLLEKNFGKHLQDEGIQILDPFSGTGTFVTRLLDKDLGMIDDKHIEEKYKKEIWSNEIMPTAYYISTLNIEDVIHQRTKKAIPFHGAVLTDTFRISEAKGMLDPSLFSGNSDRENEEEDSKIYAIISNPPYSANQGNANENNRHARYEVLDNRIASTYKALVNNTLHQANDSYVRAFRWASDRIKEKGIVAFITNAGWLRGNAGTGIRRSFAKEFNDIYVYDLRGLRGDRGGTKEEGGNIFSIGTAVAITFLVKNPDSDHTGQIHYISTPDSASRDAKLRLLEEAVKQEPTWQSLQMDEFGDWLDQRDASFYSLIPMGLKKGSTKIPGIFDTWSRGVETDNDTWLYSFNEDDLLQNVETFEGFFNQELKKWKEWKANGGLGKAEDVAKNVVRQDPTRIKWGYQIFQLLDRTSSPLELDPDYIHTTLYRPFTKKCLYFDKDLVRSPGLQPSFFPAEGLSNLELCVAGVGSHSFSCLMVNILPDLHVLESGTQCFPLYRYEKDSFGLEGYERKSAITDQALKMFREVYGDTLNSEPDKAKEQIFYYIYGLLHSKEYREKYQDTLSKDLPRIPFSSHFKEFEKAGRELAAFHVGYEKAPKYEGIVPEKGPEGEISKMRLDKDKGVLTVNRYLSFKNIPREAFEYKVNGRSPLEWVVDQYKVKTDKDSGIVSNPNDSPISDIYYVADLIPRLVTVSVRTQEIVESLPQIDRLTSMDSEIERIWGRNRDLG